MRTLARPAAGVIGVLILTACGTTPPAPTNFPPPLSLADQLGDPAVRRSNVLVPTGAPTVATQPVRRNEALITIPYRYSHTAVLVEDVTGYSMTVPGVQAPKGSPGFYAGTFIARSGYGAVGDGPSDLWCFLPKVAGGERGTLCLLRNFGGIAAIAPTRLNPWLWESFAPATGSFDYVLTPIFEKREVEIPGDLTLQYRFNGWSKGTANVIEYAVGREVHRFSLPRDPDGAATLTTVAGKLRIIPAPNDAELAVVSLVPAS